jgi:hypothetical protein
MNCTTRPSLGRRVTVPGVVAALAAATLALGASPSHAAPNKIGPVQGLDLTITKPNSRYVVASDWADLARATSYRVSLTNAGIVLQSDKVTTSSWTATTTLGAGARVTVKVVPLVGKKPGKQASVTRELPDVTAPTGTFHVVQEKGSKDVTVVQDTLSDDVTVTGNIVRTISWDQGIPAAAWADGSHSYTEDRIYHPSVTLEDEAGNKREVSLGTVVVGDHNAPTGAFEATASGWARWSKIALRYTTPVADDFSASDNVTCTVDWGDGSTDTWTGDAAPTHVYADADTYNPTVTLTDEAGNTATATMTNAVEIAADTARPTVKLTKPAKLRSVRAWNPVRGKASDVGSGVRNVKVRIAEKRNGRWYSYLAPSRTWVKGGSTQGSALKRSRAAKVVPTDGVWRYRASGLRKGTLVVKVRGTDNLGNRSKARTYGQVLTRR